MEYIKAFMSAVDDWVGLLVYAVIIVLFIVGFFRCILPVMRTRSRLRRAIRSIKAGGSQKHAWQEDAFLGKGSLYPHWSEYLNNLFFADGVYHNASNVEDYINEETVIHGPGRASFAEALPGLMVSLGFLGTLVGLAMGLAGFDMTDSAAVQSSILTLIPGMRYAFTTSIVGVIASVLFQLISRFVDGSAEHTLQDFYGAMSRYAGVISVDPMTQIAIYQQEQTALIQTMARDLNGQFTERMSKAMEAAIEPVNQNLIRFVKVNTEEQMRFLDRVVNRFVDRMDSALDGQFRSLARVMNETAENQARLAKDLRESMTGAEGSLRDLKQMQTLTEQMLDKFDMYLTALNDARAQADESYIRIASNVEQMELVSRQQINYLKGVSGMHTELVRDVEKLQDVVENFTNRFAQQSADSVAALLKASGDLRATGAALEKHKKEYSEQLDADLAATMESFHNYMTEFTRRVDHLTGGIADSLGQLPDAVNDTADQLLGEVERISATLARAQRALDDAVERMYGK